jgi:signal transduction histidine kinase
LDKDYQALSDNGKQYFERLKKSVLRMQTLIKDLLMYTKVKVYEELFENRPLHTFVDYVKQDYAEEILQKQVTIEADELCTASVIPFQFYQLFTNIIGNAIKFSKPGVNPVIKISTSIEKGDNSLSEVLVPGKDYFHITISDNGIGFDPQHTDKIFKVFQRLNGRTEYDGTGIGLSIVKKIVDNHNGFITATGEENKGARFDIYIPQER